MTEPLSFAFFDTELGEVGLAWSGQGIRRVQLPEASRAATVARLKAHVRGAAEADPPAWVRDAVDRITRHLAGMPQDLAALPLDLRGVPPFHRKIYEASLRVGPGRTITYGELAGEVGSPGASRAVGQAMAKNPLALIVPCHRVLAKDGKPGGFSAYGGLVTKAKLLEREGARLTPESAQTSLFDGDAELPFDRREAHASVLESDRVLARMMERVGPFRLQLRGAHSPFEALADAILHQQITGKAAAAIRGRLCERLGDGRLPSPEAIVAAKDRQLRAAGLSRSKVLAIRDLAAKTLDGTVPGFAALRGMEDEAIVERLTAVRGVGRWTVEMLLIFRLGRPDVLPVDDYGIRKGFAKTFRKRELPKPRELAARGERWRPYRTVASWYLWRCLEVS